MKVPEHVEGQSSALLRFFRAMGDASRLRMVGLIANHEHNVGELAAALNLREPTVSHHLNVLRDAGLLRMRVEGTLHWYSLNPDELQRLGRTGFEPGALAAIASAPRTETDSNDARVLRNYLDGERLVKIPDVLRKRRAVLRWLAAKFAPGVAYTEAEINRLIKRHHDDAATLRREMVGNRMLTRSGGIYRLNSRTQWKTL